jgi:exodeoxyribonuclease V beta subunit
LLGRVDGERQLTDLRHVGQSLHAAALAEGLGLAALTEWLRRRRADEGAEITTDRIRRLDTDAAATQVVTLHASKGLQYPVVYLPFAFDRFIRTPDMLLLHERGERVLDIGGPGTLGRPERQRKALAEDAGEALRHLYVGLTRAQSQVVTWWAPTKNTTSSGLHRVLFGRRDATGSVPDEVPLVADDVAARELRDIERRGGLVLERAAVSKARLATPPPMSETEFAIGKLDRRVDDGWRRVSYSSLSAAAELGVTGAGIAGGAGVGGGVVGHGALPAGQPIVAGDPGVGSEPEATERQDEAIPLIRTAAVAGDPLLAVPSPMADLPAGASFGTLVHAVLETTDPQAPDLPMELRERSAEQIARHGATFTAEQLAAGLLPVLSSPLGPLAPGATLSDVGLRDRLAELDFEVPLAGGDGVEAGITLGALAPVLRRHLAADDPLAGYADRLASPAYEWQPLRGYLTGSLDLVIRLPGPKYLVADYKTNWLGDVDAAALSAWHYRPAALAEVMAESDYPLQAMLYCVALHRFLRWRQPGYDPATHIGGVLYLFVRGMAGPATPLVDGRPCGVFGWRPPAGLITALSDLLDGELDATTSGGAT